MLDDLMVIFKFNEVREFYVEKPLTNKYWTCHYLNVIS